MNTLRPTAKIGIVVLGLVVAVVLAWVAVDLSQRFSSVPANERAGGMYAFGDLLLGLAVFGVAALVPIGLGLFWLRPVEKFGRTISWLAIAWAVTGVANVIINSVTNRRVGDWDLLSLARFGIMPLTALALLVAAIFAPLPRYRWLLIAAAACDGLVFMGVIVVKFMTN